MDNQKATRLIFFALVMSLLIALLFWLLPAANLPQSKPFANLGAQSSEGLPVSPPSPSNRVDELYPVESELDQVGVAYANLASGLEVTGAVIDENSRVVPGVHLTVELSPSFPPR